MGLSTIPEAFDGSYGSFNRFRQAVAKAAGGSWPPHEDKSLDDNQWYWGDDYGPTTHPGLQIFFSHSDCDGEISPEGCLLVADDLESLMPELESMGMGIGHILRDGGYGAVARRFISGCRKAAAQCVPLEFL